MVWSGLRGGGGYFWRTMVLKDLILAFGYICLTAVVGRLHPPWPACVWLNPLANGGAPYREMFLVAWHFRLAGTTRTMLKLSHCVSGQSHTNKHTTVIHVTIAST